MAVTIYAKRNGQSGQLQLRDSQGHEAHDSNINSGVVPDEEVIWKLDNGSGLSELTGIKLSPSGKGKYKNSQQLWKNSPKQNKDGSWTATILSQSPGKDKFQNYMVGYKIPGDDKEYWDDPKLTMNI